VGPLEHFIGDQDKYGWRVDEENKDWLKYKNLALNQTSVAQH
jgi:hypothetical protein